MLRLPEQLGRTMTKAQRILDLYIGAVGTMPEQELPRFVAAQIGTTDSYVRTVARQRLGRGASEADRRSITDLVREMLDSGVFVSNRHAAETLRCDIKTIQAARRRIDAGCMPANGSGWTAERVERLKTLWAEGNSARAVARILGGFRNYGDGGRSAVIGKVHRLGLPPRACGAKPGAKRRYGAIRTRSTEAMNNRAFGNPIAPVPKLPVLPIPPAAEYDRARVIFLELDRHHCKWPVADPQEAGHDKPLFCAEKRIPGSPYCYAHHSRAYTPVRPRQPFVPRVVQRETVTA